jgi:hypothetical protein
VRSGQAAGSGPVLTVRRAITMIGMDGVRRSALALRPWPGPLGTEDAAELASLIERCRQAARAARALCPVAYDAEVVFLVTMLQNLGRLVMQYHFADEAQQIRRLRLVRLAGIGRIELGAGKVDLGAVAALIPAARLLVITQGQTHDIQAAAELLKRSVRAKCVALRQARLHQTTPATLWVHGLVGEEEIKSNHILVMNGIGYCSKMRFRNFSDQE